MYRYNVKIQKLRNVPRNVKKACTRYTSFYGDKTEKMVWYIFGEGKLDAAEKVISLYSFWNGQAWEPYVTILKVEQIDGRVKYWD